jgi:hypothetical protein
LDLEVVHTGRLLEDDEDLEYILTQPGNPLIVYVPTDLSPDEFREHTKLCIDEVEK